MISKSKKAKASEHNKAGILNSVGNAVDDRLRQFASYLSERTRHIQTRRLTALLFIVCIGCSLMLTLNIFYSFKHKNVVQFQPIRAPLIKQPYSSSIDNVVYLRIKSFHHYMDSLKNSDLPHYDSIMKSRPGLMDSLIKIE